LYVGLFQATIGNADESIRNLAAASVAFDSSGYFGGTIGTGFVEAGVHYTRKEYELSNMKLDKAIDLAEKQYGGSLPSRIMADCDIAHAFNDLKEGNLGSARKRVGKIKDLLRKTKREREDVWVKTAGSARVANACGILESELCLAEGSIDKAIHIGESVPSIGILGFVLVLSTSADQALHNYPIERDVLARAYVKKGDLAKAIAVYEKLVTFDPKQDNRLLILPVYHYRLAKLYEEKGRTKEAVVQYEKFLTIMSKADMFQAEIADAKARLAALTRPRVS
jgi:tetratricopeptide (TPR) repeat protein